MVELFLTRLSPWFLFNPILLGPVGTHPLIWSIHAVRHLLDSKGRENELKFNKIKYNSYILPYYLTNAFGDDDS